MMDIAVSTIEKRAVRVIPVVETMPADLLTPLSVFLTLSDGSKNCFLLESVEGGETLARYSFIGADPEMTVSGSDRRIEVIDSDGSRIESRPLFEFLREHFHSIETQPDSELPSFIGGAI